MMSVEQQQYPGGSSNPEFYCKECCVNFESAKSLEVHLHYHQKNLLTQWASQAQQEESNNNNSKAGNHNSHVGPKRDSVTAPADSSEPSLQAPSSSPATSQQQQQQATQPSQPGVQAYSHFPTPIFPEGTGYYMPNEQAFLLPHYSPTHDDAVNNGGSNYPARYHPYQHQQHFQADRANSVSSTSPRSPLHCDKCGGVFEDANQLCEHIRANHPNSPSGYPGQPQYQQIGGSPQHSQQLHASPPQNSQQPPQPQGYDYNGTVVKSEVKQEQEEQAEILDLDSHKVQTHRYEEEQLMRLHQQQHQDMQMQLHQQQQQAMQQRLAPHSVSSMLGWPPGQPHEYHPVLSPMSAMDSASPIPDQSAFMRGQQMPVDSLRHAGSPIITSTQPMAGHQLPTSLLQQPPKSASMGNQSWKSNEARRPKTYNCTACNKWFTSSGHLKRHYNTTLHKNAVKQSNQPDPANMPISAHHHPGRDSNTGHSNRGGPSRSPEISTSGSPPNLMAGPSGEAARGLLHTPTNLYTTSNSSNSSTNSNSNDSSAMGLVQQQQQQSQHVPQSQQQSASSTVHMGPRMAGRRHHHHQQMVSPSSQLGQHHLPIGSPGQLSVHHPMTSPMHPPAPPQHLISPSSMGSHHHMNSPSPIMAGATPMASPPMGGTTMPHQPYPNALPPHVTTTINLPVTLDSITNQLTTIGVEITDPSHHQLTQDMLPGFITFSNHQRPLPSFRQFGMTGFLGGQNHPQAVNVGGLSPEEGIPQDRSFESVIANYGSFESPPRYECLTNLDAQGIQHQPNTDGMIIKQYEVLHSNQELSRDQCLLESNNNLAEYHGKEEINPNVGMPQFPIRNYKKKSATAKEQQVTSSEPDYISKDGMHRCLKCDKNFNKACYLTQHNKSFHSGEKPYKCNQCGKRYFSVKDYNQHLDKHAGDKPHKCDICPKQFNHKTDLRRHLCLHSGIKPFACSICKKGFIRKDHMMKHHETHRRKSNNRNHHLIRT